MKKTTPLKILAAGGALYAAASYLTFYEIMDRKATLPQKAFERTMKDIIPGIPEDDERIKWFKEQSFEEYSLTNNDGHKLNAYFIKTEKPSDKYIICAHGYRSCAKGEFRYIAKFLHDSGFNVLLVNHRACGESEGKYLTFGYKESQDLLLWVQFLNDRFGEDIAIGLYGISMGCATITMLCGNGDLPDNVKFAIADCGYTTAKDEFSYNLKKAHIPDWLILNSTDFINQKLSGCSFDDMSPLDAVKNSKVPTLFVHGGNDDFVPTSMVYRLFDACPAPKDLFIANGAGHAESYQRCTDEYEKKFTEFTEKYLEVVTV